MSIVSGTCEHAIDEYNLHYGFACDGTDSCEHYCDPCNERISSEEPKLCWSCKGRGAVAVLVPDPSDQVGYVTEDETCMECGGTGQQR